MRVGDPQDDRLPQRHRRFKLPGATVLRIRDFRLYFLGYATEVSGQQMLWVAQGWLIYELSGSAVLLGVAGLARALPATILSFLGGALADKLDQRRLLISVQFVQMALLAILASLTAAGSVAVWHLLVILSASAGVQAFENPARQAIFPRLIPRTALMDAVALNATVHPGTRFFGPALAGVLMVQVRLLTGEPLLGAAVLFYLTAFGYLVNVCFLYLIRLSAVESERKRTSVLADMAEGFRFIARSPLFGSLIAMTYCSMFFGWSFQSLFPVFAKDVFGGGEFELGIMHSALGAGSFLGAMSSSTLASVRRRGRLIIGGFLVQAMLLSLVAAVPWFWPAVIVLVFAGCSQSVFNVTAQSTLQYLVPNQYRGRVMGVWGMTHSSVQPLGQLQMGAIAGLASAPIAVVVGSAAMIAFGIFLVLPNDRIRNLSLSLEEESPGDEMVGRQPVHLGARH